MATDKKNAAAKSARAAARALASEKAAARQRRVRLLVSIGVVVAVLVAGTIGYAVYAGQKVDPAASANPAGLTADGGIATGPADAAVTVDLYVDYQCPVCKNYEQTVGPTLDQLVSSRQIRLIVHPIAILDRASTTDYSTRAAAAAGCAQDAGKFPEYTTMLFDLQPAEGSAGLTEAALVDAGTSVGITSAEFAGCVTGETYKDWTAVVTDRATKDGLSGTPTIKVNGAGLPLSGTPVDDLTKAVAAATGATPTG